MGGCRPTGSTLTVTRRAIQPLAALRDEKIYGHLNRYEARTAYPPVAEGLFFGLYRLHPDSVRWVKLAFALIDLAAVGLLALLLARLKRPPELALLYGWHPLAVSSRSAGTGHVEGVAVLLALAATTAAVVRQVRPHRRAAGSLGARQAVCARPGAGAPPARGRDLVAGAAAVVATVALAYLPYAGAGRHALGYLPEYLREEGFISGTLLLPAGPPRLASVHVRDCDLRGRGLGNPARARRGIPARSSRFAGRGADPCAVDVLHALRADGAYTYPRYALLAAALLPLARGLVRVPAAAISLAAPFLYLHISVGSHPAWPRHLVYGGSAVALAAVALSAAGRARTRSTPSSKLDCGCEPEPLRGQGRRCEHVAYVAEPVIADRPRLGAPPRLPHSAAAMSPTVRGVPLATLNAPAQTLPRERSDVGACHVAHVHEVASLARRPRRPAGARPARSAWRKSAATPAYGVSRGIRGP